MVVGRGVAYATPQFTCYVTFARARSCGRWFYLKPRLRCSSHLAALSFLQYIIFIMIFISDCLSLEDRTDRLPPNVGTKLQFCAALNSKIAQLSFTPRRKLKWRIVIIRLPLVRWYSVERWLVINELERLWKEAYNRSGLFSSCSARFL